MPAPAYVILWRLATGDVWHTAPSKGLDEAKAKRVCQRWAEQHPDRVYQHLPVNPQPNEANHAQVKVHH